MLSVPRSWAEVDAAWMTRALSRDFPGAVVGGVRIEELGEGTNRRARAHVRYHSGFGPRSVFVKREGSMRNRLALVALGALENEVRICDARIALPLEHPAPYGSGCDRYRLSNVVVMEDVALRSAKPNAARAGLPIEEVVSGILGLARLHAAYWEGSGPGLAFLRPWRLSWYMAPVSWANLSRAMRKLHSVGHADLVPSGLTPAALDKRFRRWVRVAASAPRTLLHGDPHPGNTYLTPSGTIGFYDWQLARFGNWSHDIGYFVASSLTASERRENEGELLRTYLSEVANQGAPAPRFEQAWALYAKSSAFGLGAWLHAFAGGGFQTREDCLAIIERFAAAYCDHMDT
ncbi:MAG: phosphotransferase family protein [Acidimicrobiales bacterium]